MPKRFLYLATSLILGGILGIVVPNAVKIFQAKAHVDSGLGLESQALPNLTKPLSKQSIESILSQRPKLKEKAITEYRKAIRIYPNYAPAYYYLGNALKAQGLKEEAIAEYRELIRIKPNFAPAYQSLGEILQEQGKLQEALSAYIQAIRHDPEFIDPHVKLASVLEKQGKLDEAIAEYEEAVRLDPNHPFSGGFSREFIYAWLGRALVKDGRLAEAIEAYVTAIRIIPNCFTTNNLCGMFYEDLEPILKKQSKPGEPISEQIKSIILHPKAKKFIEIGATYEKKGEQAVAATYYTKAIHFDPKKVQSYIDLGNTLYAQNRSYQQEAIAEFRQAIHLDPNNVEARIQLGSILESQSKLEQAIANYQEIIRIEPNNLFANQSIGMILYQQGKGKEAILPLKAAMNEYKRVNQDNLFSQQIKLLEDTLQKIEKQ